MSHEEKSVWSSGVVSIVAYVVYVVILLARSAGGELADTPYIATLLWTMGISIGASIVLSIVIAILSPKDADKKDQRDKQIYRRGEYAGHWVLVAGALAALVMAMLQWQHFWIANVIYLAFVLSSILAAIVKITGYRRGLVAW